MCSYQYERRKEAKRQSSPSGIEKSNYFRSTVEHQVYSEPLKFVLMSFYLATGKNSIKIQMLCIKEHKNKCEGCNFPPQKRLTAQHCIQPRAFGICLWVTAYKLHKEIKKGVKKLGNDALR